MSVYPLTDSHISHIRSKSSGSNIYVNQVEVEAVSSDPKNEMASAFLHVETRPSLLSSDAPLQDYRGLYNLAGIALLVLNFRMVIDNLRKYGWLLDLYSKAEQPEEWERVFPCFFTCLALSIPILTSHFIESFAYKLAIGKSRAALFHALNISVAFFGPIIVISRSYAKLAPAIILELLSAVVVLKLISYAHVNHDIRTRMYEQLSALKINERKRKDRRKPSMTRSSSATRLSDMKSNEEKKTVEKEKRVSPPTMGHIIYFIFAPTLCYQTQYPKTKGINWTFVFRRLVEIVFGVALMIFMSEQYVKPETLDSLVHIDEGNVIQVLETIIKLAIPNTLIWLIGFYVLFHSYLNLSGELLRFGDRLFYKDWWNAPTLRAYWKNWNLPVHNWIRRHLYGPALRYGCSNLQAQILVFLFSAAFHEVLISVPCHTIKLWAFLGMMLQIPLISLTEFIYAKLRKQTYGNVIFWTTFCMFGQPLLILLYAHHYIRTHL